MKKRNKFFTRTDIIGYLFVSPFVIGFIFLLGKPLIQSIIYSFNTVKIVPGGIELEFIKFENYRKALFGDGAFIRTLLPMFGETLISVVVIVFFSIFLAILLNQEFKGRLIFRTIAFFPVIFASNVTKGIMRQDGLAGALEAKSNEFMIFSQGGVEFLNELIESFGFGAELIGTLTGYVNNIFNIAWDSGIQIVLFIIGLRAIPSYLYEVCEIEGATKWETFWKITFPMLSPTILLCVVYTLITKFNSNNEIILMINGNRNLRLHYACAQTWIYTVIIFILFSVVYKVISKKTVYFD